MTVDIMCRYDVAQLMFDRPDEAHQSACQALETVAKECEDKHGEAVKAWRTVANCREYI